MRLDYDFVIIGSGFGGSVSALRLTEKGYSVAVLEMGRRFGKEDFAKYHPAGALGKRLLLRVEDVMRRFDDIAVAAPTDKVLVVMQKIATAGVGAACVIDEGRNLIGFVTEGDLRRHLLKSPIDIEAQAESFMTKSPSTIEPDSAPFIFVSL